MPVRIYSTAQRFWYAFLLVCGIEFSYWTVACGLHDAGSVLVFGSALVIIALPAAALAAWRLKSLARSTNNSILLVVLLVVFPMLAFFLTKTFPSCILLQP